MFSLRTILPLLLAALLAVWLQPRVQGFVVLGGSLGLDQRSYYVHDNFSDATASDHTIPHPLFPGHAGVTLAMWKAAAEWGSERRGYGGGDPTQPMDLGSGGANFDFFFAGRALGPGTIDGNTASALSGGSGSALAFTEAGPGGISDGWRIRFFESWTWDDGPGGSVTGFDIQGVMCHELGHALGLDHSNVFGSTMTAVLSGTGVEERSLHPDDVAGLHAIYGARTAGKPHVDSATVCGNEVRLVGQFFAATQNEVWLTRLGFGSATPLVLSNLSSTFGGTELRFGLPIAAGPGEVAVVVPGGGPLGLAAGARLSNAVPFDPLIQDCGEGTASFCTGEATPGCPGCPCGNVSPSGEGGGCANVTGRGARLLVTGSARVGATTLEFTLDHAPPLSFALLVSGQDTLPPPGSPPGCPGGSGLPAQTENGLRCLAGSTLRLGTRALNALGETSDAWEGPFPGLFGASIGQERYFQAFYRESPGTVCGAARNTSQAVSVRVLP